MPSLVRIFVQVEVARIDCERELMTHPLHALFSPFILVRLIEMHTGVVVVAQQCGQTPLYCQNRQPGECGTTPRLCTCSARLRPPAVHLVLRSTRNSASAMEFIIIIFFWSYITPSRSQCAVSFVSCTVCYSLRFRTSGPYSTLYLATS